ncbi:MAG TPA: hypothetical protein VGU23_02525 [Acidobacteriaceae bacterium]|nr:hypothetical protein [Acidobacteriaceae bacterium]
MSEEWIERLAGEIKQKNREAAERYGRDRHFAGIIAAGAPGFFVALAEQVQKNVEAIRRHLQGDATAAEMAVERGAAGGAANEIRITRARFPWVDARVAHREDTITFDYAKDAGVAGDPKLERTVRTFVFRVAADDKLYVEDAFADRTARYATPGDLARKIVEELFAV